MIVYLNTPKTESIHACGLVLYPKEKTAAEWIPVKKQQDLIVTEWEGAEIEDAGFVKEDILGIQQLSQLSDMVNLIEKNRGIKIDLYKDIPLDDPMVFEYIKKGYLGNVFHFGARGLSKYCVQMQPESLDEMAICAALYRPGPIENNIHNEYILTKRGEREQECFIGTEEILKPNLNFLCYQEDIMHICQHCAGFDLEETDGVRKAIGKKRMDKMRSYGEKFVKGYVERYKDQGVTEKYAWDLWHQMEEFGKYSFNKSHAVAYSRNGYNCIWLKVHYPIEFWSVTFSWAEQKDYPSYINEIQKSGDIKILPVDINKSDTIIVSDIKTNSMYWALNSVKQCGEKAQEFISNEKKQNGPFFSLDEFIDRCVVKNSPVNKSVIENLIYSGAFDEIENIKKPSDRYRLIESYRENKRVKIIEEKDLLTRAIDKDKHDKDWWWTLQQKKVSGFAEFDYEDLVETYHLPKCNQVEFYDISNIKHLDENSLNSYCVAVGGYVLEIVERKSKKGLFATITLESNYEFIPVLIFPEFYEEFKETLQNAKNNILLIDGFLQWDKFRQEYVLQSTVDTFITVLT